MHSTVGHKDKNIYSGNYSMECVDFYGIKSDLFLFIFIFRPLFCTFPPKMSAEENQGNVINIWNNDNNSNKTY